MTGRHSLEYHLAELSPDLCADISEHYDDVVIVVAVDKLHQAAEELLAIGFDRMSMVTAVDWPDRIELVYRLTSRSLSANAFVKTSVGREEPHVVSLCEIWPSANWQEREVFDMFGVVFDGHPDLRRILLPDEWVGWPLRKDYEDPNIIRRPDYI